MRKWISALPFLGVLHGLGGTAGAASQQALRADDFVDSIGVNVHLAYRDTPYFDAYPRIKAALLELGVRHVRDNIIARSDLYARDIVPARWRELHAAGIQTTVISNPSIPVSLIVPLLARSPAVFAGVEGPNELDLQEQASWPARLLNYQRQLYTSVNANPLTREIPVLAPSLGRIHNYAAAAALAPYVDAANIHYYAGGALPSEGLPLIRQAGAASAGPKPIVVTEAGYQNALLTRRTHQPATTSAVTKYIPRLLAAHFKHGFQRTFLYQLHDQTLEHGLTDPEAHFGLLAYDFSPKPAYFALRNLIRLLADPKPGAFAPGTLKVALHGAPANLETLLLQKKDGRFYLLLWQEAESYAVRGRKDLRVEPHTVRLDFATAMSAAIYRPGDGAAPLRRDHVTTQLILAIDDAITVIELQPLKGAKPTP